MNDWQPISDSEFTELFQKQYIQLDEQERNEFRRFQIPFFKVAITRSAMIGDERVFVVAKKGDDVLYFDDVEYGFNIAVLDVDGKILMPGGSQNTLKEAIQEWFRLK